MSAYCELVSIEDVVDELRYHNYFIYRKFENFNPTNSYPFDLEDSLLMWVNLITNDNEYEIDNNDISECLLDWKSVYLIMNYYNSSESFAKKRLTQVNFYLEVSHGHKVNNWPMPYWNQKDFETFEFSLDSLRILFMAYLCEVIGHINMIKLNNQIKLPKTLNSNTIIVSNKRLREVSFPVILKNKEKEDDFTVATKDKQNLDILLEDILTQSNQTMMETSTEIQIFEFINIDMVAKAAEKSKFMETSYSFLNLNDLKNSDLQINILENSNLKDDVHSIIETEQYNSEELLNLCDEYYGNIFDNKGEESDPFCDSIEIVKEEFNSFSEFINNDIILKQSEEPCISTSFFVPFNVEKKRSGDFS